jgi:hypothetical protein
MLWVEIQEIQTKVLKAEIEVKLSVSIFILFKIDFYSGHGVIKF